MRTTSDTKLLNSLRAGKVYRREELTAFSKAVDRDLKKLSERGVLVKTGPGLYYKPKSSRFGSLPPNDKDLVRSFLNDNRFLMFTWNDYNSLGLGLNQIYNSYVVYNYKRYEQKQLGGKLFHFRRPVRGFPLILSKEYLLVDLIENIQFLGEDPGEIKSRIKNQLNNFDCTRLLKLVRKYGKEKTQKFFKALCEGK